LPAEFIVGEHGDYGGKICLCGAAENEGHGLIRLVCGAFSIAPGYAGGEILTLRRLYPDLREHAIAALAGAA
tara:strand:- start:566 stop:781 length:216 start_codon:yes stop_codon:yes gene_type:complete